MTNPSFLRRVLFADAAISATCGLLLDFGAEPLGALFGMPPALLRWAGISLLPVAAFIAWLATRARPTVALVWLVIAGNVIWAIDSLALLFTPWVAPTLLGTAFVVAQAAIVVVLAGLERQGLRALA